MQRGVYFIIEKPFRGYVKIGKTKNINSRLRTLQTGHPDKLIVYHFIKCEDNAALESQLHKMFDNKRTRGEWFELSLEEIDRLCPNKNPEFTHENCDKEVPSKNTPDNSKCYNCAKVFKCDADLLRHKRRKTPCLIRELRPGDENKPYCIFCNRVYTSMSNLGKHHEVCKIKNGEMKILVNKAEQNTKRSNIDDRLDILIELNKELVKQNRRLIELVPGGILA